MNHKRANTKKLLVTGGHLTTAIAVIEELSKDPSWEVVFLGSKTVQEGSRMLSREMSEIPRRQIKIMSIPAGKIPHKFTRHFIRSVMKIPAGLISAFGKVRSLDPDVILSFGGFVGVPAAASGWVLGIPVITHEQTTTKGLANALIESFATAVAVSWEKSPGHFRKAVRVTGNPVRRAIINGPGERVPLETGGRPLLYITGGNQGAHAINAVLSDALNELIGECAIVHQCGLTKGGNDLTKLTHKRSTLSRSEQKRFVIQEWFTEDQVAWLLRNANLTVSRSGANIISELAVTGAPALLIPYPHARGDEQLRNAKLLEDAGTAMILPQHVMNGETFLASIRKMLSREAGFRKNAPKATKLVPKDAAERVVRLVNEIYEKTTA